MVEKVYIIPESVRGGGNVVDTKEVEDYGVYLASLEASDGDVFVMDFDSGAVTVRLSASASSIYYGDSLTLSAVVTGGESVEEVSVAFYDGDTLLGSDLTDATGLAVLTLSTLAVGSHSLTAHVGTTSSGVVSVTVNAATVVSLSSSASSVMYGASVTLSATAMYRGSAVSGGTVTFYDGVTSIGQATTDSSGLAELSISTLGVGSHTITAEYNSTSSSSVALTVTTIATSLSLSASASAILDSDTVTLSGALTGVSNASVEIYDGSTLLTTLTGVSGSFSYTPTSLSVGSHSFLAVYDGDSTHESATSDNVAVTVVDTSYVMTLTVTGSSFSSHSSPFTATGSVGIDWGDNSDLEVLNGQMSHTYSSRGTYTIRVYGNITALATSCFMNCTGLTSITIPSSVTSLGVQCFVGCTGLTSITIPSSVTSLGNNCFYGCTGLTSITIPSSVTNLGNYCFMRCTGLTDITLEWDTSTEIVTYNTTYPWITGCTSFQTFYIPSGTTSLYTAKSYPSNLLTEVGASYDGIEIANTSEIILSYADSDTVTLQAQLTDDGTAVSVSGETVSFYRMTGSTPNTSNDVLLGTDSTDNTGLAERTYQSAGIGDFEFYAVVGSFSSETYEVCDAYLYDTMTSSSGHWTIQSGLTPSYSSSGCYIGGLSSWKVMSVSQRFTAPVSMEFELVSRTLNNNSGSCPILEFQGQTHQSGNTMMFYVSDPNNGSKVNATDSSGTATTLMNYATGVYRIDFESSTNVKIYYNDSQIYSSSNWNMSNPYFTIGTGSTRAFTFKNVLIKPL